MRLAALAMVLMSPAVLAADPPTKGTPLYFSAAGMELSVPLAVITSIPTANLRCPDTMVGCLYSPRPCEKARVKSVKKDGMLLLDVASFPAPLAIEGDWSLVLSSDLESCLKTITHAQLRVADPKSDLFGKTFEGPRADCSRVYLSEPCESSRARPLVEDRTDGGSFKYSGWRVIGTFDQPHASP